MLSNFHLSKPGAPHQPAGAAFSVLLGGFVLSMAALSGSALAQSPGTASPGDSGASTGASSVSRSGSPPSMQRGSSRLSVDDRSFLMRAAGSGMMEVEASRLAADKASDSGVKSYAAMLVEQHEAANQELMSLAFFKGLTPPATLPVEHRRAVNRLSKRAGEAFDLDYMETVGVKAHQKDIKLFERASRTARDPDVKAWAAKTLPTLRQHLAEAQKMPMVAARQEARRATNQSPRTDMPNGPN